MKDPTQSEEAILVNSDFGSTRPSFRKSARLSSALLNYSRPDGINLIPLGSSWALDIFARLNNGARRELIDLYNMIDSMQKRVQDLRTADLNHFFVWWHLFSSYLEVVFDCYEHVLLPWLSNKHPSTCASLTPTHCTQVKEKLAEMLQNFHTVYTQMTRRPPDETMAKIIKSLVGMHPIVEYFESIENNAPDTVEQNTDQKDVRRMERKLAKYIHSHGDNGFKKMHLLIMTRAMTDQVLSAWQKAIPSLIRISYRTANNKFTSTHLVAVRKLAIE